MGGVYALILKAYQHPVLVLSTIKKLASQTAIYGLSSIIGRFLNYVLVPLHVQSFTTAQYGIISEMYSYVAFLVVLLTYGMETAFFRYFSRPEHKRKTVYFTVLISLLTSTVSFILLTWAARHSIANVLKYPDNSEYVTWFAIIVGLDAVSSIPLALLRATDRPFRFALVNLSNVFVNIGLNLFFLGYCMPAYQNGDHNWLLDTFYNPQTGVGYVFIANLAASIFKFVLLIPQMIQFRHAAIANDEDKASNCAKLFQPALLKKLLFYGLPLLVAGLAGIVNETIDRILLKQILFDKLGEVKTMTLVGIYGGVYKISIIITLFIQAFRYAAEPFFFTEEKKENATHTYARVMNWFVIVCASIFVGVMLFIDIIKYFTPKADYWQALHIVPVLLFANIFLGIYYNQSVWYKLTGKTMYGAWLSIAGAIITLCINFIFIPLYTYQAAAWATFACYAFMMLASFYFGRIHFPVPYQTGRILIYLSLAFSLYLGSCYVNLEGSIKYILFFLVWLTFTAALVLAEKRNSFNPKQ